jgi:hypothetical protein
MNIPTGSRQHDGRKRDKFQMLYDLVTQIQDLSVRIVDHMHTHQAFPLMDYALMEAKFAKLSSLLEVKRENK